MSNETEKQVYTAQNGVPDTEEAVAAAPVEYADEYEYEDEGAKKKGGPFGRKNGKQKNDKIAEEPGKLILRIVISILVIALGIFIILWCVAKAALYESIGDMLRHMWVEWNLMWARILD